MDMGLKSVKQVFVCWKKLSHFKSILIEKKEENLLTYFDINLWWIISLKWHFLQVRLLKKMLIWCKMLHKKVKQLRWLANATLLKALALFWSCFNSCLKSSIKTIEQRPAMPERFWWHFQRHCSQLPLSSLTFNCYLVTWFIPLTKRSYL